MLSHLIPQCLTEFQEPVKKQLQDMVHKRVIEEVMSFLSAVHLWLTQQGLLDT